MAKSNCWNQFLEKAEGKEIFKAFTIPNKKELRNYQSSPTQIETMREKIQSHLTKNAKLF